MAERTEILTIEVSYHDALAGIDKYQQSVEDLQKAQKNLKEELKIGSITQSDYNKAFAANKVQMDLNRESIRSLEKEIKNNIKTEKEAEGSIKSLQAQVSNLTKAYDSMSKQERESAKGKEFLDHLNDTKKELNSALEASGRYQQNVGNYKEVLTGAASGGNAFVKSLLESTQATGGAGAAVKGLGIQITAMGKSLLALLANPIVIIIAAITAAVTLLYKAFTKNTENTEKFSAVLSKVSGVFDVLLKAIEPVASFLADVLLKAINSVTNALVWMLDLLGFDEVVSNITQLNKTTNDLAVTTRILTKAQEEEKKAAADLNLQLAASERIRKTGNLTISQQIDLIKKDRDATIEAMKVKLVAALAERNLIKLQIQQAALQGKSVAELEKQLATSLQNIESITSGMADVYASTRAQTTSLYREAAAKSKEFATQQLQLEREIQDAILNNLDEGLAKQRALEDKNNKRRLEDLKKRLKDEPKNVETINKLIEEEKVRHNKAITALDKSELERQADIELTNLKNRVEAIKEGSAEYLSAKLELFDAEKKQAVQAAKDRGEATIDIEKIYEKKKADEIKKIRDEAEQKAITERQLKLSNDLLERDIANKQTYDLEIAALQRELEALKNSGNLKVEEERNFNLRIQEIEKQRNDARQQEIQTRLSATAGMFGALSDMTEGFAEQSAAFASFSKALALTEILINQGQAIAAGIRQAMSVPFPGNIAAIATTIAAIATTITQATSLVKKAKTPSTSGTSSVSGGSSQRFADGGEVPGVGSGDIVPALLTPGEFVMTRAATAMIGANALSSLNNIAAGIPTSVATIGINNMEMGNIIEQRLEIALKNMPSPIVSVVEITDVANRVQVNDERRQS